MELSEKSKKIIKIFIKLNIDFKVFIEEALDEKLTDILTEIMMDHKFGNMLDVESLNIILKELGRDPIG